MPEEYTSLVAALKALQQADDPKAVPVTYHTLPMAEDEWYTRPDTVSYGTVRLDFEAGADNGDDLKASTAYEGSVDLFSMERSGAGWIPLITGTLESYCQGSWRLNTRTYERETGLYHWEWVFHVVE